MKTSQTIIIPFVILSIIIISSLSYFFINDFQKTLTEQVMDEIEEDIKIKTQSLENYFTSNTDKTKLYTIFPEIQGLLKFSEFGSSFNFDKNEWVGIMTMHFKEIIPTNPDIAQISILDIRGEEIVRINSDGKNIQAVSELELQNKNDQYYFKDTLVLSQNQVYISDIEFDEENKSPHESLIRFATLIADGSGENMGIMVITHSMDRIISSIAQTNIGSITIVDNNGQVIYDENNLKQFDSQLQTRYNYFEENPLFLDLIDTTFTIHDEEKQMYKFWNKVSNPNDPKKYVVIIVNVSQDAIFEPIQHTINNLYYFAIVFILVTVAITVILSSYIAKPFEGLIEGIKQVQKGDYDTKIKTSGSKEAIAIGESFNELSSTLKVLKQISNKYTKDCNNQLNEIKLTVDALDESMCLVKTNGDQDITYVNDRFCKLSGYTRDELLDKNLKSIQLEQHQQGSKNIAESILYKEIQYEDMRNKRKDGSIFWTRKTTIPIKNHANKIIEYLIIQENITQKVEHNEQSIEIERKEQQKRHLEKEFTKMVFHDIRDPISVISGNCEILKNTSNVNDFTENQKNAIESLCQNARKLDLQIEEMLNIYHINSHKINFKKSTFTVYLLIEKIIINFSSKIKEKQIKIVNDIDPLLRFSSDESYLSQVIDNLIQNALEFTPKDGGIIRINAKIEDQKIVFQIQDNGAGFSFKVQNNLLKNFYEIDTSNKREHKPYEIRIIICKGIIEELGGKMKIESHQGFGSTFYFELPFEI